MRLATETNSLETGGAEEQGTFRIKATGKAFRILIDGLYSKKIPSIVREITANAFDAHKAMRNPAPFYVHAPTKLRPEFYVRDYGVGMTNDKVMNLYSTLFDSDKDADNDLVGMFGLGSKSPFAYTDQFYVTCYDGGSARHYGAAIGPGGVPQIILLKTEACDEPLGVRVGFHVHDKDFSEFEQSISRIALGFDPVFETNAKLSLKLGEKLYEGKGWACYADSALPSTWNVRQGCVIYPLVADGNLGLPFDNNSRKYLIDAPIGTVEVTTSREQVAYSPKVVTFLKKRLAAVEKEIAPLVWEKVADIKNVAKFFRILSKVKPNFVNGEFKHPFTGLTSTNTCFNAPSCLFLVSFDAVKQRWDSSVVRSITAEEPKETTPKTVYHVADISALLDQAREANDFSIRERRRVMRVIRTWLEASGKDGGNFWLGVDWTDEYIKMVRPNTERIKLTVAEMLESLPDKKKAKLKTSLVRGVALITGDSTEQKAIRKIEVTTDAAWITADHYRRDASSLRVVAKKFGITTLYVASSVAYKTLERSGVKKLDEAIDAILKTKYRSSWAEWTQLSVIVPQGSYYLGNLLTFIKKLREKSPEALKRLSGTRSLPGELTRHLTSYVANGLIPFSGEDSKSIKLLNEGKTPPKQHKTVARIAALAKKLGEDNTSPAVNFIGDINKASSKAQLDVTTTALIAVFRAIPSTMKFKDY